MYNKVFLVDFENVSNHGIIGGEKLDSGDKVIILYSDNANKIKIELLNNLLSSGAEVEFRKVFLDGKDSLDFQLVTYLGLIAAQNKNSKYFIISQDLDYEVSVKMLQSLGYQVSQQVAISEDKEERILKNKKAKNKKNDKMKLESLTLKEVDQSIPSDAKPYIDKNKLHKSLKNSKGKVSIEEKVKSIVFSYYGRSKKSFKKNEFNLLRNQTYQNIMKELQAS